jgi:hypothetical protein
MQTSLWHDHYHDSSATHHRLNEHESMNECFRDATISSMLMISE